MIGFDDLTLDMDVIVSDGAPEPPERGSPLWRHWASHNFTGTVVALRPGEADVQVAEGPTWTIRREAGHVLTPVEPSAELLDAVLQAQVDVAAGEFRRNFITAVPGQELTYQIKEVEARAWTAEADPAGFPYLAAEAQVRGISLTDMVAMILEIADQWRAVNLAIEVRRIQAKAQVAAATTREDKEAAAAVDWMAAISGGS